jgi:peptidyl-prolyl cis-trans isomerase D
MTPSEFEDGQRGDLLQKKLHRLITDAIPATDEETKELYRIGQERVNVSFLKIASADLFDQVTIEKKDSEDYYNTHRESFRQPERVRFTYVTYPAAHFESQVQVTPQEEETFYNNHKGDRFTTPAQVHARHILFSFAEGATEADKAKVKETATGVLARARAGEDFATLAKTYSQDPGTAPKGGDLGFFPRGRMVKSFEEAAFNLSAGSIGDLVESQFGYHIIKAEAVEAERVRTLEETRAEIRQELVREGALERARAQAEVDRNKASGGSKLAEVAQAAGLTHGDTPLVSRDETIPELGRQPDLIQAALALAVDQVSAPVKAGEAWYLLSPREKVESKIPDFATVSEEATKRARSEKAEQLAKTKADALLAKLKETKDLTAVATEAKLSVEETGPFTRQGSYIPKMGNLPEFKKEAFRLTPEAPVASQAYVWGGNAFIAVLKEQIPASTADFDKQKERLREDLRKRKQAAAFDDFVNTLKKNANVVPNMNALLKIPT